LFVDLTEASSDPTLAAFNLRSVKSFGGTVYGFCASASYAPVSTISAATGGTLTGKNGARITLYIVVLVALIAAPIGLAVGAAAGYLGGWVDKALMRVTDVFLAFPSLILALAFVAALGPGIENAVIAIALTSWPPYARIARAETLTIRNSDYISVARIQGAGTGRILLRHVMPLCVSSLTVRVTLDMAGIILTAAGLGFLGLGAQPPMAEWGAMVSAGRRYVLDQWWVATIPGIAIFVVSLAFNLLGDGLRDVLDPRQKK
jgi:peptide/nickel transport system permease protein